MVTKEISPKGKIMEAKRIKKILFGVLLSDGSLDRNTKRFDLYSKEKQYAVYIQDCLSNLTHTKFSMKEKVSKYNTVGYRVWSTKSKYLNKTYDIFYPYNGRKVLTKYIVDRLDAEALAHVWMCDGYLEHAKNRKKNKIQNIGWLCLESFPKEELEILQRHLSDRFGIETSLVSKPWGFGYRIRICGDNLQKFISLVYPFILDCFKYKTELFYKEKSSSLELPSAEHFIKTYNGVDDIVRHSLEKEKTNG